jgi:superoxide dismutase, Fe-Mn family
MVYKPRDFSALIGTPGFSDTLLGNHFTLYQGYINNTNKLWDLLINPDRDKASPDFAELKRRFGWEFNGMRLHELYFENLSARPSGARSAAFSKKLADAYGSAEAWEKDFRATGAMRGIGWVVLYQDNVSGWLYNQWINEHDVGHLSGCRPLLVMDVFEHAFITDYGLKRADYIEAFFKAINWKAVETRL